MGTAPRRVMLVFVLLVAVGLSACSENGAVDPCEFKAGSTTEPKVDATHIANPPPWRAVVFEAGVSKVLSGTASTARHDVTTWCHGASDPGDTLAGLTIVALPDPHDVCRVDGEYNHADYPVTAGRVRASDKTFDLPAWRIEPPLKRASKHIAGGQGVRLCLPERRPWAVYKLANGELHRIARIEAKDAQPGWGRRIADLTVHDIEGPLVIALAPAEADIGALHKAPAGIEVATLHDEKPANGNPGLHVDMLRIPAPARPFDADVDFHYGLNDYQNRWAHNRHFWMLPTAAGADAKQSVRFAWQSEGFDGRLYLTDIAADRASFSHVELPRADARNDALAAATGTLDGTVFYLLIQRGDGAPNSKRKATMIKVDGSGKELLRRALDTGKGPGGLNIIRFNTKTIPWFAAMRISGSLIGLQLARTMGQAPDGLNHQGEIGAVFSTDTLGLVKMHGQLAGHSLSNRLVVESGGTFLGLSLGDNFPRGVVVTRFDGKDKHQRVVYTFKTRHGSKPTSPAGATYPFYENDAKGEKTYRWSNDNNTYTELGAVLPDDKRILVLFAGEKPPLANEKTLEQHSGPRNLGLVAIRKDFENASKKTGKTTCGAKFDNVVTDDLVFEPGASEGGGFYDFQGRWCEQRNTGIKWLTDYADPSDKTGKDSKDSKDSNVSRLDAHRLPSGGILVTWERWSAKVHRDTWLLRLDATGNATGKPHKLHQAVRFSRRGDKAVAGQHLVAVRGHARSNTLSIVRIR